MRKLIREQASAETLWGCFWLHARNPVTGLVSIGERRGLAQLGAGMWHVTSDWLLAQATALPWHSDMVGGPKPGMMVATVVALSGTLVRLVGCSSVFCWEGQGSSNQGRSVPTA